MRTKIIAATTIFFVIVNFLSDTKVLQIIYYALKSIFPRSFQLLLRRQRIKLKKTRYKSWPINEDAAMIGRPEG
ncbi:MAG: hypothetical protein WCQ99_09040, partial [Pseudomonadota bacterium]